MDQERTSHLAQVAADLGRERSLRVSGSSRGAALAGALVAGLAISACSQGSASTAGNTNDETRAQQTQVSIAVSTSETLDFVISERGLQYFGNPQDLNVLVVERASELGSPIAGITAMLEATSTAVAARGQHIRTTTSDVAHFMGEAFEAGAAVTRVSTFDESGRRVGSATAVYADMDQLTNLRSYGGHMSSFFGLTHSTEYAGDRIVDRNGTTLDDRSVAAFVMLHEYRHTHNLHWGGDREIDVLAREIDSDRAALDQFKALFGEVKAEAVGAWVMSHRAVNAGGEAFGRAAMYAADDPDAMFFVRGDAGHVTSLGVGALAGRTAWSRDDAFRLAERSLDAVEHLADAFVALGQGPLAREFRSASEAVVSMDETYFRTASGDQLRMDEYEQMRFLYPASRMIADNAALATLKPDMHRLAGQIAEGTERLFPGLVAHMEATVPSLSDHVARNGSRANVFAAGSAPREGVTVDEMRRHDHVGKLMAAIRARQEHANETMLARNNRDATPLPPRRGPEL